MNASNILAWMIIFCLSVLVLLIFSKPLKVLIRMAVNGICGVIGIFVTNILLSPFQIAVGINMLSVLIVSVLGIPGFLSLYLIQVIL